MPLTIHKDSHLDHGLTEAHLRYLQDLLATCTRGAFADTIILPPELPELPCSLYGPTMGDAPIEELNVYYGKRGTRPWYSRLTRLAQRPTRILTVIAGPHDGDPFVLYTAYAGPQAPREPGDPQCPNKAESELFWSQHALAT